MYNVRSFYQFNEDLHLQQLDSEVCLTGQRLGCMVLHGVGAGVAAGIASGWQMR